jgi:hypothetical protein
MGLTTGEPRGIKITGSRTPKGFNDLNRKNFYPKLSGNRTIKRRYYQRIKTGISSGKKYRPE